MNQWVNDLFDRKGEIAWQLICSIVKIKTVVVTIVLKNINEFMNEFSLNVLLDFLTTLQNQINMTEEIYAVSETFFCGES